MKKYLIVGSTLALFGLLIPTFSYAADGPTTTQEVKMAVGGSSLIGITGGTVNLSLTAGAATAGQSLLKNSANADSRLRMSSFVTTAAGATHNKITAKVTTGTLYQKYTKLYLRLKGPTATTAFINSDAMGDLKNTGDVTEGSLTYPDAGAIITSSTVETNPDVLLVDNIGFCWTGTAADAADAGYVIEYTYGAVTGGTPKSADVTITYTIASDPTHP